MSKLFLLSATGVDVRVTLVLVCFHLERGLAGRGGGGLYISFSFVAADRGQIVVNSIYSAPTPACMCARLCVCALR